MKDGNSTGEVASYVVYFVPGYEKWEIAVGGENPFDDACFEFPGTYYYEGQAKKLTVFLNDKGVKP